MAQITVRINKDVGYKHAHLIGSVVVVECDDQGVPLDSFWRRRLRDSAIDGCVEIVKSSKSTPKDSAKSKGETNELL